MLVDNKKTKDDTMNTYLNVIATHVKGKDIRSAIHDGMQLSYNDAYDWYDQAIGTAEAAYAKAIEALDDCEAAKDEMDQAADDAALAISEAETANTRVEALISEASSHPQDTWYLEVVDARTTYSDVSAEQHSLTYTLMGDAIRNQCAGLSSRIRAIATSQTPVTVNQDAHVEAYKIWENSSPTTAFAAQNITIPYASFTEFNVADAAEFIFKYRINANDSGNIYYARLSPQIDPSTAIVQQISNVFPGTYGYTLFRRNVGITRGSNNDSVIFAVADNVQQYTADPYTLDGTDLAISDQNMLVTTDTSEANTHLIPVEIYAVIHSVNATLTMPKDTEILDARVGADGITYESLGDAIRNQVAHYIGDAVIEAINSSY